MRDEREIRERDQRERERERERERVRVREREREREEGGWEGGREKACPLLRSEVYGHEHNIQG